MMDGTGMPGPMVMGNDAGDDGAGKAFGGVEGGKFGRGRAGGLHGNANLGRGGGGGRRGLTFKRTERLSGWIVCGSKVGCGWKR
jgi:hypothetical protein